MEKRIRPGVDPAIEPAHGVTPEGQPLSYNRAPAADLAPWIARLYVTSVDMPGDHRIDCGLFNDCSSARFQLRGNWIAQTADGPMQLGRSALLFGPLSRRMPISVSGSFTSIGMMFRPGSCYALLKVRMTDHLDRIAHCDEMGLPGSRALELLEQGRSAEEWLQAIEGLMREFVDRAGGALPDPVSARFEALALANPAASISQFAQDTGIDQRRLERVVRRDFGMPPKQVLRRARALDMASYLRGVADEAEGDELALRYYDQSHQIREFVEIFGMTPKQFAEAPLPLLTLGLESRQARRLEAMERLAPGAKRPWE